MLFSSEEEDGMYDHCNESKVEKWRRRFHRGTMTPSSTNMIPQKTTEPIE